MLWRESEHEPLSERFWTAGWAQEALEEIVADAEAAASPEGVWPFHPQDDSREGDVWSDLYLGSAGMAWALWRLGSRFDAAGTMAHALERYRATPDRGRTRMCRACSEARRAFSSRPSAWDRPWPTASACAS